MRELNVFVAGQNKIKINDLMFCNTEFRRKQTFNLSHYSIYVILSLNLLTKSKTMAYCHKDLLHVLIDQQRLESPQNKKTTTVLEFV